MIYICVPSQNNATTVGLLLWKVRQVLAAFPREYHLLVADDGSTDHTGEVLSSYGRVLPMSGPRLPPHRYYRGPEHRHAPHRGTGQLGLGQQRALPFVCQSGFATNGGRAVGSKFNIDIEFWVFKTPPKHLQKAPLC